MFQTKATSAVSTVALAAALIGSLSFARPAAANDEIYLPEIPAALEVPEGHTLSLTLYGIGYQIYTCSEVQNQPGTFTWRFTAPWAHLFDAHWNHVGTHFGGPTWRLNDGSQIVGTVQANVPAPVASNGSVVSIAWLLLSATSTGSNGLLSDVSFIQRLDTHYGLAPTLAQAPCSTANLGQQYFSFYKTLYTFYMPQN